MKMAKEEKKDSKLEIWFKAKVEKAKAWYNRDDNFLRVVRFPGTKLPMMDVLIDFIKLFTKGRTVDRAAGVAFNFFVALFPLILFFFTLIPYIPIPHLYDRVMTALDEFLLPSGTLDYVKDTIDGIMNQPHDGLLSLSVVMCLVFGSNGVVAFFNGFRNVYANYISSKGLTLRDWIEQRLFAIAMLLISHIGLADFLGRHGASMVRGPRNHSRRFVYFFPVGRVALGHRCVCPLFRHRHPVLFRQCQV